MDASKILPALLIIDMVKDNFDNTRKLPITPLARKIIDPIKQYIVPTKAISVAVIDLLYGDAAPANEIIKGFTPTIKREEYTQFMKKLVE